MTNSVILVIIYPMIGISTVTSKGQVAIPKDIRDHFGLKAFDTVHFQVINGEIVMQPVTKIADMLGVIRSDRLVTPIEAKRTIKARVAEKYAHRA